MGRQTWALISCLMLAHIVQESSQIVLKSISVPERVESGKEDVILDCDYELEERDDVNGLVVKWQRNDKLVYQWIYGIVPKAMDEFRNYIDLDYNVSEHHATMYRAMKMNKPEWNVTGNYKCLISTEADEKELSKTMVVYSKEEDFQFVYTRTDVDGEDGALFDCSATKLYPMPSINISIEGYAFEQETNTTEEEGLYTIRATMLPKDSDLPDYSTAKCIVSIPDVNYNTTKMLEYSYKPSTTTPATTTPQQSMDNQMPNNNQPRSGIVGGDAATASLNVILLITGLLIDGGSHFWTHIT